jgi:hypothetical protein
VGLFLLILGLGTLEVWNLDTLSFPLALNYSKYILSYILRFLLVTAIRKLVLNSVNIEVLLRNLCLLLLALFTLALFSMIYTIIFDG